MRETRIAPTQARPSGTRAVLCLCDCGTETVVGLSDFYRGQVLSCGCWKSQTTSRRNRESKGLNVKHGLSKHWLFQTWHKMLGRCENEQSKDYRHYGARGIQVYEPWHDVAIFVSDIERLLGARPEGMTLDRIDNDGNYEPGNCRWATPAEQAQNRRPPRTREVINAR